MEIKQFLQHNVGSIIWILIGFLTWIIYNDLIGLGVVLTMLGAIFINLIIEVD